MNVQTKSSSIFLMLVALFAKDNRYSANFVANYANLYVLDALQARERRRVRRRSSGVPN